MSNIIKLTFTDLPQKDYSGFSFSYGTGSSISVVEEYFNETDTGSYSIAIPDTIKELISNVYNALIADYGTSSFTVTIEGYDTIVITMIDEELPIFDFEQKNEISPTGITPSSDTDSYTYEFMDDEPGEVEVNADGVRVRSPKFIYSGTFSDWNRLRIIVDFTGNPSLADELSIDLSRDIGPAGTTTNFTKTFTSGSESLTQSILGDSREETITKLITSLQTYNDYSYIEYINNIDEIYIDLFDVTTNGDPTYSVVTNDASEIVIGDSYTAVEIGEDGTNYEIYVWEGEYASASVQTAIFSKNKQKIISAQEKTYIDFTSLTRNEFQYDISNYIVTWPEVIKIPSNVGKWCMVTTTNTIGGYDRSTETENYYYLVDGYISPYEQQGIPKVLITGDKFHLNSGSLARVFFQTQTLEDVYVYENQGKPPASSASHSFASQISGSYSLSDEYLNSVKLIDYGWDLHTYVFQYLEQDYSIDVTFYDECKYEVIDVFFKNKYGVIQTISMSKVHSIMMNTTKDTYNRSIVDYEGVYSSNKHSKKDFNVTGREVWTLNSDFVPERMNNSFEELFLSEEVWVSFQGDDIKGGGGGDDLIIYPVTLKNNSISYKTHIKDKLINYTFNVELSHENVNNIR